MHILRLSKCTTIPFKQFYVQIHPHSRLTSRPTYYIKITSQVYTPYLKILTYRDLYGTHKHVYEFRTSTLIYLCIYSLYYRQ